MARRYTSFCSWKCTFFFFSPLICDTDLMFRNQQELEKPACSSEPHGYMAPNQTDFCLNAQITICQRCSDNREGCHFPFILPLNKNLPLDQSDNLYIIQLSHVFKVCIFMPICDCEANHIYIYWLLNSFEFIYNIQQHSFPLTSTVPPGFLQDFVQYQCKWKWICCCRRFGTWYWHLHPQRENIFNWKHSFPHTKAALDMLFTHSQCCAAVRLHWGTYR